VLKGGICFTSDLLRALTIPVTVDFMRPKSYAGTGSRNRVDILAAPTESLTNRTVLLVEDILDTGRTTAVLLDWIAQRRPAAVRVATLLNKQARRVNDVRADYVGFEIDDQFVVGYGLDYNEKYRELPGVHTLNGLPE
jgi:hypoxanthine phosphoribosyltransferase